MPGKAERKSAERKNPTPEPGRRLMQPRELGQPATPREVARRAREELYREHILKAAEQIFADQGFEAAKVQDISRSAGLSMGSIYALFPSKDALFALIMQTHGQRLVELARRVVESHDDPVGALEALARTYIDYFFDHPNFLRMHIRTGASWALNPNYTGHQASLAVEVHELHKRIFTRGIETGAFVEEDPAYLALLLTGIDQVHLASWVAGGMEGTREELLARFLRVVRKTFLR